MRYLGDYAGDDTVYFTWCSCDGSGGRANRTTDGTIRVYKDNGTTEDTAGVTDTGGSGGGFDSITGLNLCTIDLSGAFYVTGADYNVVLDGAVIDSQTVTATIATFSIENRYMRGTDSAALASVCTEGRLGELDAANIPSDVDDILEDTEAMQPNIDAAVSSRATPTQVNTECGNAIETYRLDELVNATAGGVDPTIGSIFDLIMNKDGSQTFSQSTDSLEAANEEINGNEAFLTTLLTRCAESRMAELDAANIPADVDGIKAVTDNLPNSGALTDIDTGVNNIEAKLPTNYIMGSSDQTDKDDEIDAIKAVTDNLPNSGALTDIDTGVNNIEAKLPSGTISDITTAQVNAEVEDVIVTDCRLDELMVTTLGSQPTAGSMFADLTEDDGGTQRFNANALEQAPTGGTNPNMLLSTTIASVTSQTVFTLTAGSNDDDAYKDQAVVVYDASDNDYPSVRKATAYNGSTSPQLQVTLDSAPDFTIIAGDGVKIFVTAPGTSAPTAAENADAVWDEAASGHTTGGTFGAQCGTDIDDILTDTAAMQPNIDQSLSTTESNIRGGTETLESLNTDIDAILADTGTDGVKLADAAITSAKFDGSSAYPITSQDSGTTQIARVGADGDTLETLSDQIDSCSTHSADDAADSVWDEATADHTTLATFGRQCGADIDGILADTANIDANIDQSLSTTESNIRGGTETLESLNTDLDNLLTNLQTIDDEIEVTSDSAHTGQIGWTVNSMFQTGVGCSGFSAAAKTELEAEALDAIQAFYGGLTLSKHMKVFSDTQDGAGHMTEGRKRFYDTSENCDGDDGGLPASGTTGLLAEFTIDATWSAATASGYLEDYQERLTWVA